ncbi:nicotinate-nucleotide adenylyltransferase [uncultured Oxalicibacterium sp.]|uniref:nicotinate-nucleotide adenylyltransferase n=1 Tax=uncultured Oxalicibacterium sp. TaxID=1168540 RepID=UPI0025D5E5AA|nr:nicotinate-nucleotide adenylyltransferase [uncultured Oxalicibacterium sp.]
MTGSDNTAARRPCILLLGGSFDPVHRAHVALADYFVRLFQPDVLRIIPAGNPWQKKGLQASATNRIAMLERAFAGTTVPFVIDTQEIHRTEPTYTVDTLRHIRTEVGAEATLIFLMGGDQLQGLQTWHDWRQLFAYTHIAAASRPGFSVATADLDANVAREIQLRAASATQLRQTAHGHILIADDLAIDISATEIRQALQGGQHTISQLPPAVLDYIEQHHLYRN